MVCAVAERIRFISPTQMICNYIILYIFILTELFSSIYINFSVIFSGENKGRTVRTEQRAAGAERSIRRGNMRWEPAGNSRATEGHRETGLAQINNWQKPERHI